jgi:integrase
MPRLKLTARRIDSLHVPAGRQVDYWDLDHPGFGVRVAGGGRKTWIAMYRHNGRLRRHSLGTYPALSLADARDEALQTMARVATGKDPAAERRALRNAETFGELAEAYLERHAKVKKRSWKEDDRILKAELLPHWRHTPLRDLRRRDVRNLVHAIAARPAPIMANRTLALVRKMLNFAIEAEWLEANPASLIPKPGTEQSRDRVLTQDEIKAFWVAVEEEPPAIRAWLRLRLLTVQRGGEVVRMRWSDVDLQNKWWTIPAEATKNKLAHRVPLNAAAGALLRELRSSATLEAAWVCASSNPDVPVIHDAKKAIARVRRRMSVDFRGHDLRRTAASVMASAGVSRLVVAKVLNHVETGVTAVYDRHSYDAEKRAALDLWGREVQRILRRTSKGSVIAFERQPTGRQATA